MGHGSGGSSPQASILVVEDNPAAVEALELILAELGYRLTGAVSSASDAIKSAARHRPDLVLMDIGLEGSVDGIEAATILHGKLGIPVIYTTGSSDRRTVKRACDTDPFGYLVKPFDPEELERSIELALHRHASEQRTKKRERLWGALVEADPEAVVVADENDRIVSLNGVAEYLLGLAAEQAEGQPTHEVVRLVAAGTGVPLTPTRRATERRMTIPLANAVLVDRGNTRLPVGGSVAPIIDSGGQVVGSVFRMRVMAPAGRVAALDLNALLAESLGVLMHLVGPDVHVVYELDDDIPGIDAERQRAQQLLIELIALGCGSMSKGKLTIRTATAELSGGLDRGGTTIAPGRYAELAITAASSEAGMIAWPTPIELRAFGDGDVGTGQIAPVLTVAAECGAHLVVDDSGERQSTARIYFPVHRVARGPTDVTIAPAESESAGITAAADTSGRRGHVGAPAPEDPSSTAAVATRLHRQARDLVAESMRMAQDDEPPDLAECKRLVRQMAACLDSGPELLLKAMDREQPFSASAHCVNVAVIALEVATACGLSETERELAGLVGLLHELSANRFSRSLVQGPVRLAAKDVLRAAPGRSATLVRRVGGEHDALADVIAQVYERADGSGFPAGLKGGEISEVASVVGIADVFDDHIREQPGRSAISGYDAISRLVEEGPTLFSPTAVKGVLKSFSLYPHGEFVLLTSGEIGKVIAVNKAVPSRPVVSILSDDQGQPLAHEKLVDLAKHPMMHVVVALTRDEVPW
jgi:PAS domain S-box-containing protein